MTDRERQETILHQGARGIGDALFVTTVAEELRRRAPGTRVGVETHWPQLFYNNPSIAAVFPIGRKPRPGAVRMEYSDPWPPPPGHVLELVCRKVGIESPRLATYYYPTSEEIQRARQIRPPSGRPLVVVHPFSGFFAARSKCWHFSNWQRLLELLPPEIETVRYGGVEEPATPTDRPLHREMIGVDLRLFAAILREADAFVGSDSGLAHLATALGVPSVVLFTGYVPPTVFGYPQNVNLAPDLPYAPCWKEDGCEPCGAEICTRAIAPESVLDELLKILGQRRQH